MQPQIRLGRIFGIEIGPTFINGSPVPVILTATYASQHTAAIFLWWMVRIRRWMASSSHRDKTRWMWRCSTASSWLTAPYPGRDPSTGCLA